MLLTGIANACEQNLRRTFQYGGRVEFPNSMELKAMLVSGPGFLAERLITSRS